MEIILVIVFILMILSLNNNGPRDYVKINPLSEQAKILQKAKIGDVFIIKSTVKNKTPPQ